MRNFAPLPLALLAALAMQTQAEALIVATYSTQGLSGNASQWNGTGSFVSQVLPAVRGAGLGLGGGLNQFAATGVATTPTLNLANNEYVRFGFTLSFDAGAEFAITSFRASCGGIGMGSVGMQYQVWGFFTDQTPFPMHDPATLTSNTLINLTSFSGNTIIFPGQTAEFRVYFWNAASTQNGIAFISDGNPATPDVEFNAIPIPASSPIACLALASCALSRRRRT